MTDRVSSLTIVLEQDIRIDDVQSLMAAIMHLEGVINVKANVADISQFAALSRAHSQISRKLFDVLNEQRP